MEEFAKARKEEVQKMYNRELDRQDKLHYSGGLHDFNRPEFHEK